MVKDPSTKVEVLLVVLYSEYSYRLQYALFYLLGRHLAIYSMRTEIRNAFGEVYLTIEYLKAMNVVYNNWIGYQTYAGIVGGANTCLQIIEENHCPYMLNDNSRVVGPWDHALEWLTTDWAPRAIQSGLTHFAHVVSSESFAALSAQNMHTGITEELQMRIFDSTVEALEWLRTVQQT